jgi:hypothetical protein
MLCPSFNRRFVPKAEVADLFKDFVDAGERRGRNLSEQPWLFCD